MYYRNVDYMVEYVPHTSCYSRNSSNHHIPRDAAVWSSSKERKERKSPPSWQRHRLVFAGWLAAAEHVSTLVASRVVGQVHYIQHDMLYLYRYDHAVPMCMYLF